MRQMLVRQKSCRKVFDIKFIEYHRQILAPHDFKISSELYFSVDALFNQSIFN